MQTAVNPVHNIVYVFMNLDVWNWSNCQQNITFYKIPIFNVLSLLARYTYVRNINAFSGLSRTSLCVEPQEPEWPVEPVEPVESEENLCKADVASNMISKLALSLSECVSDKVLKNEVCG